MAAQEEELSSYEHFRRLFLEKPVEDSCFISSCLVRQGIAETLLDNFARAKLTRGQLEDYIAISNKLENSLMRRASRLSDVVHETTGAWLTSKRTLAGEELKALMKDPRFAGLVGIVYAYERSASKVVLASMDPTVRDALEALRLGPVDWEEKYGFDIEGWREGVQACYENETR